MNFSLSNLNFAGPRLYNMMTCSGFIDESAAKVAINFGACSGARLVGVGLFFLHCLVRKWIGEEMGIDYNFWGGLAGTLILYVIAIGITGNMKIGFIAGLIGMGIGGFGLGLLFGGSEDGGYG